MASTLLDVNELAYYLGVHYNTVYKLIKKAEIPYCKVGGQFRFDKEAVVKALSKRTTPEG